MKPEKSRGWAIYNRNTQTFYTEDGFVYPYNSKRETVDAIEELFNGYDDQSVMAPIKIMQVTTVRLR